MAAAAAFFRHFVSGAFSAACRPDGLPPFSLWPAGRGSVGGGQVAYGDERLPKIIYSCPITLSMVDVANNLGTEQMTLAADILIGVIAAIHGYFLILEMFLWTTDRGRRIFGTSKEFATDSKTLAANQGLYNGVLAAGLVWSLLAGEPTAIDVKLFFLISVIAVGVYGAVTVNRRILAVQAAPAAVALLLVMLSSS
jgi:putative membrane protein